MKKTFTLILITGLLSAIAQAQHKTSMDVKDLNSSIEKYIKNNYAGYKTTEAFKFDELYEMVILKADTATYLVFDANGKFMRKKREPESAKIGLQTRVTMPLKEVEENITKYITKNYKGYKLTEAYKYDEIYAAKVVMGESSEKLAFDKDGTFIKKMPKQAPPTAKPSENNNQADTIHHTKHTAAGEPEKK